MAEQEDQIRFLLSDFSTRLRDLEEKNRLVKERVILLGKNLISIKQDTDEILNNLKIQTTQLKKELEKQKSTMQSIIEETQKNIKKEEIALVERMLKDFQPLEFIRKKDLEELVEKKLSQTKEIKTSKTKKSKVKNGNS